MRADAHRTEAGLHVRHHFALHENDVPGDERHEPDDHEREDERPHVRLEEFHEALKHLAVNFSQNNIERADDGNDVRDQVALHHRVKGLQIDE